MLAGHWHEETSHLRVLPDILIERLTDVITKRDIILRFATHFAGMTTYTPSCIDKPTISFTI
jgi:hypothetical protein